MSRPARSLPPEIPSTENPPGSRIDSENASCPASPPISSSSKFAGRGEDPGEDWDPPNVSVLVPVKNEEKVVGRLLDALVRLDYPKENLEVVVVEDESRDRTLEICKGYSAKYPWIKVFHRDSSLGKGDALNFAFHRSTGEIVATFDADDV